MALSNRDKIDRGLQLLAEGLAPFVGQHLTASLSAVAGGSLPKGTDWVAVLEARDNQRGGSPRHYSADDPRFLLRIVTEEWRAFDGALSRVEQSYASELREVGKKWAHNSAFSGEDTGRALDTVERLLTAVGAGPQAAQVGRLRLDHQRALYDAETRRSVRAASGTVTTPGAGVRPWREVITPHRDVVDGQFNAAEYAADLHQVATGQAISSEYTDPAQFFARTYLTEGLTDLLTRAVARIAGDTNASPVVNLQTTFGGGKTHSMLALYHLFSGTPLSAFPQAVQDIVTSAWPATAAAPISDDSADETPAASHLAALDVARVALVGTHLSPNQPLLKDDGTPVHTLWGELAWQLGGRAAFDRVAQSDATGTPPGDVLADVIREHAPVLIEIDEWVAYARGLYGQDGLAGGTFENQFTFAQHLTEAVRAIPSAMLVVSIPASDTLDSGGSGSALEVGGANGRAALDRLQHVVGRAADHWRPASSDESFEIVKRRLFVEPDADARREIASTARQFVTFYREHTGQFPRDAESGDYERRMVSAYPIHPELFDRLYGDWSTLERFQRTRGVLRLMSTVIHALWVAQDASPLITPGTVPIHIPNVFNELRSYLPDSWAAVVDGDVDGEESTPVRIDEERPTFGSRALTRRIARAIFLASAPTRGTAHRGAERQRIWLGVAIPGDTLGNFGSALDMLGQRATYLYADAGRYWYDTTASVTRTAADIADRLRDEPGTVWKEIVRRLRGVGGSPSSAGGPSTGGFASVVVGPDDPGDISDGEDARLVVLHPKFTHTRGDSHSAAMRFADDALQRAGSSQRARRNTLVFAAADAARYEELDAAVRDYLAWSQISSRAAEMDLTAQQSQQAATRRSQADQAVDARIAGSYLWALIPEQPDAAAPAVVSAEKFQEGPKPIATRVTTRLERDGLLTAQYGALGIGLALNGVLRSVWDEGHVPVGQLWDLYTRYPYLDRLRDRSVLIAAVRSVFGMITWRQEGFALAAGWQPGDDGSSAGRYLGLVLPEDTFDLSITDDTLLVKPDVAQAQRDAETAAAAAVVGARDGGGGAEVARVGASDSGSDGADTDDANRDGAAGAPAAASRAAQSAAIRNAQYEARTSIDSGGNIARQLGMLAQEVLAHLAAADPDQLDITVHVSAAKLTGFSEQTVRTVTENGRTLGLSGNRFEDV